jgi:hypothetical protein
MTPMIDSLTIAERAWLIGVTAMAISALLLGFCLLNTVMEIDKPPSQSRDRRPDALT